MTEVLLIEPPSRKAFHARPPIALLYLAGFLQKHKVKVKILDPTKPFNINTIKKINPKFVAITCYTPEFEEVVGLAKSIKKILPKSKLIVGGTHPTLIPSDFSKKIFNKIIIGDGELQLLNYVKKTKIKTIEDFLPAYNLINMDYYTKANPYAIRGCYLRSMYILATRGCPSQCTFCVAKKLREINGCIKIRKPKELIKEIKLLKNKYKIDSFYFIDDLFTVSKQNVLEFCKLLKQSKLNLLWACNAKVSTLDENVIKEMANSGCIQIDFGVERGSDNALKLCNKFITIKQVIEIFALCNKYNIRTFANFLTNLPHETKKDLNDILKLTKIIHPDIVMYNTFTPYPGTEIYENSPNKFEKSEYILLYSGANYINTIPNKFKFCNHNVNLAKWSIKNNKKNNHYLPIIKFHFSKKYFRTIIQSQNKTDYLKEFLSLIQAFIFQKF